MPWTSLHYGQSLMVGQGKTGQGKSKGSNNWGDER